MDINTLKSWSSVKLGQGDLFKDHSDPFTVDLFLTVHKNIIMFVHSSINTVCTTTSFILFIIVLFIHSCGYFMITPDLSFYIVLI